MNRKSLAPRFSKNFFPRNMEEGLLQSPLRNHPPFLYQSFPLFSVHQQPPLLPLPAFNGGGCTLDFSHKRTLSFSPNYGRFKNHSRTPKKPRQVSRKEEEGKSTKDVVKALSFSSSEVCCEDAEKDEEDKFSGSAVFTLSPPPSSLPLPTFSLRPKLSCGVEVAGIDAGASDNLCRLLRIR